jgi:threonine/homoserine/homoserine lactone efflux protein
LIVHLDAFVGLAAVLIIAPGLDTALITRNALLHGRRTALATALGVNSGMAVWTLATGAGLAALLEASALAFTVLKLAGAAYLVWMGLTALLASRRGERDEQLAAAAPDGQLPSRRAYRQGLACNLANPKAAAIFTGLFPQFVSGAHPSDALFLLLGAIFTVLALLLQGAYALAAARASRLLLRARVRRALDRVTGAVLIGLGIRLALARR